MIGIDTNVLVRYLTQDDAKQALLASKLIQSYTGKVGVIFINNIVFCELIWVLESGYKYSKAQIASAIRNILCCKEFCFEYLDILWIALALYENENADFSDALISELNKRKGCQHTYSFDKSGINMGLFKSLEKVSRKKRKL
jgi:predicted nucleic-acid-binding protein